jgi:hypothetical protein
MSHETFGIRAVLSVATLGLLLLAPPQAGCPGRRFHARGF